MSIKMINYYIMVENNAQDNLFVYVLRFILLNVVSLDDIINRGPGKIFRM